MKKTILFMAALAALAVVTSCSSDEELVQEPVVDPIQVKDSGIPLTIETTTSDATRAVELDGDNFALFQLWAFETGTNNNGQWIGDKYVASVNDPTQAEQEAYEPQTGAAVEKSGTPPTWSAPAEAWPTNNLTTKFYAISAQSNGNNDLTPHITADSQSFTYTVAADAADQEDLLVGSATATAKGVDGELGTADDGKISIPFTHALSKVNFRFKMNPASANPQEWQASSDQGLCVLIHSIELHKLYNTGTYTFGTGWSDQTGDGFIKITPTSDIQVVVGFKYQESVAADPDNNIEAVPEAYVVDDYGIASVEADELITSPGMVLPQEITPWSTPNVTNIANADGAYMVLEAKTILYLKTEAVTYFNDATDDDTDNPHKLFALTTEADADGHHYYYLASDNTKTPVAREDGVILDFSKIPEDHGIDFQVRTSSDGQTGGTGYMISETGYGHIYKALGAGSFEFTEGHPYRLVINLLTGLNDENQSPWGDFGQAGSGSRQINDDYIWEE